MACEGRELHWDYWENDPPFLDLKCVLSRTSLRGLLVGARAFGPYEQPPHINAFSAAALRTTIWLGVDSFLLNQNGVGAEQPETRYFNFTISARDDEPSYVHSHYYWYRSTMDAVTAAKNSNKQFLVERARDVWEFDGDCDGLSLDDYGVRDIPFSGVDMLNQPLFPGDIPDNQAQTIFEFPQRLGDRLGHPFWRNWYQGFIDGRPIDWDLQRRIALETVDQDWASGPTIVARRIEAITAAHHVEQVARDVLADITKLVTHADLPPRGNNSPPEIISYNRIVREIPAVEEAVKTLMTQAGGRTAVHKTASNALDLIANWTNSIAAWLGRKADLAVDTVIKWAIPTGGGYILLNPGQVQELVEAGKAWLALLN